MSELSEQTKVKLQMGGAVALLFAVLMAGKYWGTWESDGRHTATTVAAHETRITSLETRMANIDTKLAELNTKADAVSTNAAAAARTGTFMVDSMAKLQVALAEHGLTTKLRGD